MPTYPVRRTPSAWHADATAALHAAMRRDHDTARAAVQAIAARDPEDLPDVLLAWCDTLLSARGLRDYGAEPFTLDFGNLDTLQVQHADDVPPAVAWAGRLIAARAADDQATFEALILAAVDGEGDAWGQCVMTTLNVVALNLVMEAARRGRTGRES